MRTLLKILLIGAILGIVFGSCRTSRTTKDKEKEVIIYTYKDSVVIRYKDSTVYRYKDSTVTREGINTGVVIKVAEKIKPFSYHLKRGNVLIDVIGDSTGNVSINIDMAAEQAYRERLYQEYQQHIKDSAAKNQKTLIRTVTHTIYKNTTRTVWPWWLWAIIAYTVLSLFFNPISYLKNLITYWRTKK
jgi:hypothetical protein